MARTGWNYPPRRQGDPRWPRTLQEQSQLLTIPPNQKWDRYETDIRSFFFVFLLNVIWSSSGQVSNRWCPPWLNSGPLPAGASSSSQPLKTEFYFQLNCPFPPPSSSQQPAALGTATLLLSHGEHSWKHVRDKGIWSSAAVLQNTACLHNYPDIQNILSIKHQNKHKHRWTVLDVAAV